MTTYPALNKALVIDPSGELRDFMRFCAGRFWPSLKIVSYLWARGCPDEKYDWSGYDLVVMEQRLHTAYDRGIEWLRAMRQNPAVPPIVLISSDLSEHQRAQAERVGAAAVLEKNDLSPCRFAECVEQVLRPANPATPPKPPQVLNPRTAHTWPSLSAEVAALQVPGFRIVQPITSIKRGWLSLAIDESTEQSVALKIVRMTGDADQRILRRFEHEYGVVSGLKDRNVVRVFKHGTVENYVFLAMEYCTGGDLGERIRQGISMQDALGYLLQIMRGLNAVHARGILHRDLKPTNVLFRENGTLALTDFGVERDLSDDPRLTSTRSLVLDLNYVSPESIRHGVVDLRSDLYSAGVIFYHMLTGSVPFKGDSVTAMLEAHLNAPIPKLPRPLASLQPLLNGLLEKNPNDRFQSAADVLDGIDWLSTAVA